MIVYRDDPGTPADPRRLLAECGAQARVLAAAGRPAHDDVVSLLVDLGVAEAAVADALFAEADGRPPVADDLRAASVAAGRLLVGSWRGAPAAELQGGALTLAGLLDRSAGEPLPAIVRTKAPEGYAYYALYPETYLAAAHGWVRDAGPGPAVVIGVRSIGTSLAAVVAAALEAAGVETSSLTVRPRGHPFDRRPALTPGLEGDLRAAAGSGARLLVVDEGPGMSGSSLTGTAAALAALGVPDHRITLFPSHLPDPAGFVSSSARERWGRHGKAHAPFEAAFPAGAPWGEGARDLSGGGWRGLLHADERAWPAVHPWHERRKYLAAGERGAGVLHKFVGLGRYGALARRRAVALAEAGFAPPVLGLERGFLRQRWIEGARPLGRRERNTDFLIHAADYVNTLSRQQSTGAAVSYDPLAHMLRANVAEALGPEAAGRLAGLDRHLASFGEVPAVAVDGRMLPHEWLLTPAGTYLKTDGVDHHADHFFPGPDADLAWDVAGLAVEFGLDDATVGDLAAGLGDPALPARLPFHTAAYLAFRMGYASMAADTLAGTADGARMGRLARRYRRQLRIAVERLATVL